MFAASVYFDHHWIIDGAAGWAVAVVAVLAAKALLARRPSVLAQSAPAASRHGIARQEAGTGPEPVPARFSEWRGADPPERG
jgi:membrane-associated phospholipid phosphatase